MNKNFEKIEKIESVLKLEDITIRNAYFERHSSKEWEDFSVGFNLSIKEYDEKEGFEIIFSITMNEEDVFDLKVECGAFFNVIKDDSTKIQYDSFHANALAIMFPYIRAYITQITAIPNMKPIVFPALNINALLEELRKEQKIDQD